MRAGHVWHICAGRAPQTHERMVLEKSSTGTGDCLSSRPGDETTTMRESNRARNPERGKSPRQERVHRRVGEDAPRLGGLCPIARTREFSRSAADRSPSRKISIRSTRRKRSSEKTRVNGMRDSARWKHRRRLLGGSKPAKGNEPQERCWIVGRKRSNQAALSAAGSGTSRGKENAATHDPIGGRRTD